MFSKIKVLVVDDSAFMRKMIGDMLNSQPDIEVIDAARNGEIAINKVKELDPDVITMDVEMPVMNGLEALKEIRGISQCQVIMLSSVTFEGSSITIEALRNGAFDFIQKPSGSISLDIDKVKNELAEKIRYAYYACKKKKTAVKNEAHNIIRPDIKRLGNNRIEAVLIGASTGGPRVLFDIITELPENLNVPVFVVQHMPKGFTKAFADRINKSSRLNVIEAVDRQSIIPNTVYIAPGGYHMLIESDRISLDLSPQIHGVRPAVDKLFISAADNYRGKVLGCILTGMGRDGAEGIKKIKGLGGYTIGQDEETSTVYGMPKAAFETGCLDMVLPVNKISEEIIRAVKRV